MQTLTLSHSLKNLLEDLSSNSPCCHLLLRALRRQEKGIKTRLLNPSPIGDHFTFRESEGQITYCPAGRQQRFNENGTWSRDGRQGIKPAKWLRLMLHPRLASRVPDHVFGDFATKFRTSEEEGKLRFEFVPFEEAYHEDNYHEDAFNSCMWNEPVETFFACYPCRVLIARDAHKYRGRAIVWDQVEGLDAPLLDRVYNDAPEVAEAFFRHAASSGWYRKARQNNSCFSDLTGPSGEIRYFSPDSLHVVPIRNPEHAGVQFWPYLDTFRAMTDDGKIYNSCNEDGAEFLLDCTDGERTDAHDGQVLCADGEWRSEDDVIDINGQYYADDDDDVVSCHRSGNYILRGDAYEIDLSRHETVYIHRDYVSRA